MCSSFAPAPKHAAVGMEFGVSSTPLTDLPCLVQARVAMRPFDGAAVAGHTGWFVLSPEVARRMAADLVEAAEAAERGAAT